MSKLIATIHGQPQAISRLLRRLDQMLSPLQAHVPTEILALQQALDSVQHQDQSAHLELDHPLAWVAAARLTALARADGLRASIRTADPKAIQAPEQVAYLGDWHSDLNGRREVRGVVWETTAGFHPGIETSTYNSGSEPGYGEGVPSLQTAIQAAEDMVAAMLIRDEAEPHNDAGGTPQP